MSGIGGVILGHAGLSALQSDPGLAIGVGLEGVADGIVGGAPYDFSSGIPEGLLARNGQTYTALGGFTDEDTFTNPDNGDKHGIWETADSINGADDCDMRLTFAWYAAADTTSAGAGPSLVDVNSSSDGLSPYRCNALTDRNFNRILPGRFSPEDQHGVFTPFTNSQSIHALTGGELTADGSTLHTIGFSKVGDQWTTFFDGVIQDGPFTLTAGEIADIALCTRIGVGAGGTSILVPVHRLLTLEYAPAGDIY